jgi:hypothetical protein
MPRRSNRRGISIFWCGACPEMPHRFGYSNVQKCPTGYGLELSSHDRQIGRMARRRFSITCRQARPLQTRQLPSNRCVIQVLATRRRVVRR